jgi:hypothetical protein
VAAAPAARTSAPLEGDGPDAPGLARLGAAVLLPATAAGGDDEDEATPGAVALSDEAPGAAAPGAAALVDEAALVGVIALDAFDPLAPAVATSLAPCAWAIESGNSSAGNPSRSLGPCQARYNANTEKAAAQPAIRIGRRRASGGMEPKRRGVASELNR